MAMSDEEYSKTQGALVRACVELEGLDLAGFQERAYLARQGGAAADHVAHRRGAPVLEAVIALADAGRTLVTVYHEHPREMLSLLVETYGREGLAGAGIV